MCYVMGHRGSHMIGYVRTLSRKLSRWALNIAEAMFGNPCAVLIIVGCLYFTPRTLLGSESLGTQHCQGAYVR